MRHVRARRFLPDYREGRLAPRIAERVAKHLARCRSCNDRSRLEAFLATELAELRLSNSEHRNFVGKIDVRETVLRELAVCPPAGRPGLPWPDLRWFALGTSVMGLLLLLAMLQALPQAFTAAQDGTGLLEVSRVLLSSLLRVPFILLDGLSEPLQRLFVWLRTLTPAVPALMTSAYTAMTLVVLFVIGRDLRPSRLATEEN